MSRIFVSASGFPANANIQPRHPAEYATWIWHPEWLQGKTIFLRFVLKFDLAATDPLTLHVSADQRYQLQLDGNEIGYGPDRCDIENWTVTSYTIPLDAGHHRLEALVWWLADDTLTGLRADPAVGGSSILQVKPPIAQATWRGGFLLAGDAKHAKLLNTGHAPWLVENCTPAIRPVPKPFKVYHDIGPEFHIDGTAWTSPSAAIPAKPVAGAILGNPHGVQRPGWRLTPATLAEQTRMPVLSGRLRALAEVWSDGPFATGQPGASEAAGAWSLLLSGLGEVTVPAHSERTVLWDFEDYVCGYAELTTWGGPGALVRIDWAEALHQAENAAAVNAQTSKGHRDEIADKVFCGFGDEFRPADGRVRFPALWWRAGRFLRICVRTADQPLRLTALTVRSTGYPLGAASRFVCDEPKFNTVLAIAERTIRASAHEIWTDSPYYEQAAYIGDNRLDALCNYALFADDRLSRRAIELFDQSRRSTGLAAERYPDAWHQVSPTYSLLWVLMVHDFAWWRDDAEFVRVRLRGIRSMLDEILALRESSGLLGQVPGWPFVDWVPEWDYGCAPGVRTGDSSILNLHLLLALRAAAALEASFGEPELAVLAQRRASHLAESILSRFWCGRRGLLADTSERKYFSEHAQALGLLAGLTPPGGQSPWIDAWLAGADLAKATLYFSFYVLEALFQAGRGAELHKRLGVWQSVPQNGLHTMPEAPEPTRSDCHGWSAHIRWHAVASVAGVRPMAPGFARVLIAPQLGELTAITGEARHPRGTLGFDLRRRGDRLSGTIHLPPDVQGELLWQERRHPLRPGVTNFDSHA